MAFLGRHLTTMNQMLKEHSALRPLIGACIFSGSMAVFMMAYTSLKKQDVVYNRWAQKLPHWALEKHNRREKLVIPGKHSEQVYLESDTVAIKALLDEIYSDGRYSRR